MAAPRWSPVYADSIAILDPTMARHLAKAIDLLRANRRVDGVRLDDDIEALYVALIAMSGRVPLAPSPDIGSPSTVVVSSLAGKNEVTVSRVTELLDCSPEWVRSLCRTGEIAARRIGRSWLIDEESVMALKHRSAA